MVRHKAQVVVCLLNNLSTLRCLQKKYPKDLPSIAVVLIYLDEALSIIKRAICSIINRTPEHLLREIILVDDHSSNGASHSHHSITSGVSICR